MSTAVTNLSEAQALYYEDLVRLRGQRGAILECLFDGKWHKNHELAEVALSFNDSIFALRKEGWIIESRRIKGGIWEFRLAGKGEPPTGHKAMSRPQAVVAGHYMHVIETKLGVLAARRISAALPQWMRAEPREWEPPVL